MLLTILFSGCIARNTYSYDDDNDNNNNNNNNNNNVNTVNANKNSTSHLQLYMDKNNKSVVSLAGAARSHTPVCRGADYNGETY